MDNRENDPTIVHCHRCDWEGLAMDCVHSYESDGGDDVVPQDYCPACNSQDLEPLEVLAYSSPVGLGGEF